MQSFRALGPPPPSTIVLSSFFVSPVFPLMLSTREAPPFSRANGQHRGSSSPTDGVIRDVSSILQAENEGKSVDWNREFPWTNQVLGALQGTFRLKSFRPIQHEVINSAMSGRDTLVLLPTGGGKSLVFQLPAVVQAGFALVVSPLVALMHDQARPEIDFSAAWSLLALCCWLFSDAHTTICQCVTHHRECFISFVRSVDVVSRTIRIFRFCRASRCHK